MFGFNQWARLKMHEKTLDHARGDLPGKEDLYARAMVEAARSLYYRRPSTPLPTLDAIAEEVPTYALPEKDGEMLVLADHHLRDRKDLVGYHCATIVGGLVMTRSVEIIRPSFTARAQRHRRDVISFAQPLYEHGRSLLSV